ncbi:hypothetical protein GCM10027456_22350 [Kineosporia babensis]
MRTIAEFELVAQGLGVERDGFVQIVGGQNDLADLEGTHDSLSWAIGGPDQANQVTAGTAEAKGLCLSATRILDGIGARPGCVKIGRTQRAGRTTGGNRATGG